MTNPFTPINQNTDRLDIAKRGNQLMIVKVWDHPEYVRTPHNKDGMVRIDGRDPFPNRAIRAAIVDLGAIGPDGQPGVLYPETWFQASSMMKTMKSWVGQLKLITWLQDQEPKDPYGNPRQTNPYTITDHTGNAEAVALATDYLARHPEFHELPAPAPYDGKPPVEVPQYAQQQGYQQQNPGYGQPQYHQGPPPQQQWQAPPPQWQQPPQAPQQPAAPWNTAAPPPEYYQQPQAGGWTPQQQATYAQSQGYNNNGSPMQQPQQQAQPGSFFAASQGQPAPQYPQSTNHHGNVQDYPPPF